MVLFISFFICTPLLASQDKETNAKEAADAWLTVVDAGDYDQSWDSSATLFQHAITKDRWHKTLAAVRKPLGKVLSRKIKSKEYTTKVPNAPDGEYVVITYDTSFENKPDALETIVPALDRDGNWHISGYFIK